MASVTVTASCLASNFGGVKLSRSPGASQRVCLALSQRPMVVIVRAQTGEAEAVEKRSNSRRDAVLGIAAAAMFWSAVSAAGEVNAAEEEPKKGSPEAKKKYAPVCVTMPTSRICHS